MAKELTTEAQKKLAEVIAQRKEHDDWCSTLTDGLIEVVTEHPHELFIALTEMDDSTLLGVASIISTVRSKTTR